MGAGEGRKKVPGELEGMAFRGGLGSLVAGSTTGWEHGRKLGREEAARKVRRKLERP